MSDKEEIADSFFKRYTPKTLIVTALSMVALYGMDSIQSYIDDKSVKNLEKALIKSNQNIINKLDSKMDVMNNTLLESREVAITAHTKNILSHDFIMYVTKEVVWSASEGKLHWILNYMDNRNFIADEAFIRMDVEPELAKRTLVYVSWFKRNLVHPRLGDIGKYLEANFDWSEFIDEVVAEVNKKDKSSTVRVGKIRKIMQKYQNKLWMQMERKGRK